MPYPTPPRSAYLHIPFCHRRCYYCDFAVVPLGDQARGEQGPGSRSIREYLSLLHREIASAPGGPPLSTVYIGGGTPSLLCPDQIGRLLEALEDKFGLQPGAEITLEMDPATFDTSQLSSVLAHGVNRISLGGQSFDDAVLEQLGRRHRRSDLQAAIDWLMQAWRDGALRSWSLDLIQNLPGQALAGWDAQLNQAIASQAPHLSIYDLSVEPGTVFDRQRSLGVLKLPEEDLAVALMERTTQRLAAAGLSRYEISNYASPGHASRHNRVYWSGAGWWGFGMGATSAPWGVRLARPRTRAAYAAWLDNPQEESIAEVGLPLDDQLLVGLRRREGVTLQGLDADALVRRWQPFVERGWLKQQAGRWCLTDPEGMALSNQVLIEVILWYEKAVEQPGQVKSQLQRTCDGCDG